MHELSIMESALALACSQAEQARAKKILGIKLRIGDLSGVVPEALDFAFEALSEGTLAEGAKLEMVSVKPRFWCRQCSKEFEAGTLFSECPSCGTPSAELRAGREMELASLEIE